MRNLKAGIAGTARGWWPLAQLRCRNYTHGMNTDTGPTLTQVLGWLDEGVRETAADRGSTRPEHVIWTMLERATAALKGDIAGVDRERAGFVMSWVRYMRYRGADPIGVRKAALLVAGGAKARHVAGLLGRSKESFTRQRLMEFRERIAQLVLEGLADDHGVGPAPSGGFSFLSSPEIDKTGRL